MPSVTFEFPMRAVPGYLHPFFEDANTVKAIPPGHRFLLFFEGTAYFGSASYGRDDKDRKRRLQGMADRCDWKAFQKELEAGDAVLTQRFAPLKDKTLRALSGCTGMGDGARKLLQAVVQRQEALRPEREAAGSPHTAVWVRAAKLTAPLVTGVGNPHPVEVGFSFLNPYGVPYLPGSGVKGVMRRAAEELALFASGDGGWSLPLVWGLFGFDATSAPFTNGEEGNGPSRDAFDAAYRRSAENDADRILLGMWLRLLGYGGEASSDPAAFLEALRKDPIRRRTFHWRGLLTFDDAFPSGNAEMAVDILNPHHKSYYETGASTPHDAEQPIPVYFLVLKPGARFTFRVGASPEQLGRLGLGERWRGLLDEAFEHAAAWLGFGAKTAVGYGIMETEKKQRPSQEPEERQEGTLPEGLKEPVVSVQPAPAPPIPVTPTPEPPSEPPLSPEEAFLARLREVVSRYEAASDAERKTIRPQFNEIANEIAAHAGACEDAAVRERLASSLEEAYNRAGWHDPGVDKKKREKQEKKRREAVEKIRRGKAS